MAKCTEERFLEDIKEHAMEVIQDDGVMRYLRFSRNGSSCYAFNIITWNGCLCIRGDCGTYVFSRVYDMFNFFRMDKNDFNHREERKLNINPDYWGEKLLSICKTGEYKEFSQDVFESNIKEYFESNIKEYFENQEEVQNDWQEIEEELIDQHFSNDYEAMSAAYNFRSEDGFEFTDFGEWSCKEYTFSYLWCLYAIVWGIEQYDIYKKVNGVTDMYLNINQTEAK